MRNERVYTILNIWILGFLNYGMSKDTKSTFPGFVELLDVEIKSTLHVGVPYQAQFSQREFKWLF